MKKSLTEKELRILISLAKRVLWDDPKVRQEIQKHKVNIVPANFYSDIPLIDEINSSFEYVSEDAEIYNEGIFNRMEMEKFIQEISVYAKEFDPPTAGSFEDPNGFYWNNPAFSKSDAMAYYCILRHYKPDHVLEIGSGFSTFIANEALTRNGKGKLTLIEPYPKKFLKNLNKVDLIIDSFVQDITVSELVQLIESAEVWFIDSTHTVKIGSDCLYIYLKIMPKISNDILIHSHDVYLPFAPPQNNVLEKHMYWTEQYLLYAYMLDNPKIKVLYGSAYANKKLNKVIQKFMGGKYLEGGGSIWYKRSGSL